MPADGGSLSGLPGRYALALLELADERKQLDAVAQDLGQLKRLIEESADMRTLLRSPLYGRDEQNAAMTAIMQKAEISELTQRFVSVVTQNRRLFTLPAMIESFLAELARRRGEVTAQVVSAVALSDEQRSALSDVLRQSVGGKIQVDNKVDPSVIGGLIVRVGSRMIDNSLRSKLARLQLSMKGVG